MHGEIIEGSSTDKNRRACYDYIYKKAIERMKIDPVFKKAVEMRIKELEGKP